MPPVLMELANQPQETWQMRCLMETWRIVGDIGLEIEIEACLREVQLFILF